MATTSDSTIATRYICRTDETLTWGGAGFNYALGTPICRTITANSTGVTFTTCLFGTSADNSYIIPLRIYGFKQSLLS